MREPAAHPEAQPNRTHRDDAEATRGDALACILQSDSSVSPLPRSQEREGVGWGPGLPGGRRKRSSIAAPSVGLVRCERPSKAGLLSPMSPESHDIDPSGAKPAGVSDPPANNLSRFFLRAPRCGGRLRIPTLCPRPWNQEKGIGRGIVWDGAVLPPRGLSPGGLPPRLNSRQLAPWGVLLL
jgi:hypothetical protein